MTTVVRETERKYELADEVELPGWNGLVGVQPVVGPEEQTLEAVYFDTEDLGLARAGVTLRRRLGGHDAGWHGREAEARGALNAALDFERPAPSLHSPCPAISRQDVRQLIGGLPSRAQCSFWAAV